MDILRRGIGRGKSEVKDTLLFLPADEHSGSVTGLMRPGQWQLANGGYYNPGETQRIIFDQYAEAVTVAKRLRKGKRLVIANVGDAVDGNHHGTTEIFSPSTEEHELAHIDLMDWTMRELDFDPGAGDLLYYIAGTPTHVKPGAQSENRVANDLGAVPKNSGTPDHDYNDARYVWNRLLLDVNGVLFDLAHHGGGVGRLPWTLENPLRSRIKKVYFQYVDAKVRVPRYWIRADKHVYVPPTRYEGGHGVIEGVMLPALQSKTEFGYKVAGHELSSIGVFMVEISGDGDTRHHCPRIYRDEDEVQTV